MTADPPADAGPPELTPGDVLVAAVGRLSERETGRLAQILGGMAAAAAEESLDRLACVWWAVGLVVYEEHERQRQVLADLEPDAGADGG